MGKEDFQKILGFPANYEYWNGDDISENLFLLSMKKPLRFGHEKVPFIEEGKVINNFLCALSAAASKFRISFSPLPIKNISNPPNADKLKELKDYFWGWGNFVIFRKDCEYKTNGKWDNLH